MGNYSSDNTALLIVDPFNDFLSEGGKLWNRTKETDKELTLLKI
jgi:nicotinamidase-related amidase